MPITPRLIAILMINICASTTFILSAAPASNANAQELSDSLQFKVKKIATNISKTRQSLANQGAAAVTDEFKTKQLQQRIESYGSALAKMPSSDDTELLKAKALQTQLIAEFNALVSGGGTAKPATTTTTQSTASPKQNIEPANKTASKQPVPELVSGQRVRVKKLARDITNVRDSINTEGPSELQDPEIVAKYKKRLDQFTEAVKRYPQVEDPDVITARNEYSALRTTLQKEYERAKSQLEKLGDVPARLRQIENRDQEYPVPEVLKLPFNETQASTWLQASSKARTAAEFDFKQLQEIAPIAHLPEQTVSGRMTEYSFRDIDRLGRVVRSRFDSVQTGYQQTISNIDSRLQELGNQVQKGSASANAERVTQDRANLDEMIAVAESSVILETVLQRTTESAQAVLETVHQRRKDYDLDRENAIDKTRLPAAASTDPERLQIAEQIIAIPRYEFGEHGPIVLNTAEIKEHEKETSEIDIDKVDVSLSGDLTMSGTKTTWFYKWQQFQFAVPLREEGSDLWRIFYINAKYFTSGGPVTPLNEWISGGVVEGDLIREANF